ncbi:MAG: cytochrome-c peroxidase [Actinomycetota bacterium]
MKRLYTTQRLKGFYAIAAVMIVIVFVVRAQQLLLPIRPIDVAIEQRIISNNNEPLLPIPLHLQLDSRKVKLGEKLFGDPKLSHDNTISCATCHNLKAGGTDLTSHSLGINGEIGLVNTPTVFNSVFNFRQFWDGRAVTLEEQIEGPTTSSHEMGSSWSEAIAKLKQDPDYISSFKKLYPEGINRETIKDALANFVRSLYTPNSRFDKYLRGDKNALTEAEKKGYRLFKEYGCASCHQGVNVGGNMFQRFGILADYFAMRGNITEADRGRANITGEPGDINVFKVPSLRNVELTPPYFHDGSVPSLETAVAVMAKYQLGEELSPEDTSLIVQFLKTLTGEYQGKPL